jgi:hypothetical protein
MLPNEHSRDILGTYGIFAVFQIFLLIFPRFLAEARLRSTGLERACTGDVTRLLCRCRYRVGNSHTTWQTDRQTEACPTSGYRTCSRPQRAPSHVSWHANSRYRDTALNFDTLWRVWGAGRLLELWTARRLRCLGRLYEAHAAFTFLPANLTHQNCQWSMFEIKFTVDVRYKFCISVQDLSTDSLCRPQ